MLIILGEYIHYLGEYIHYCKMFKGDRTRCRPTTVLMSMRAIRLSHVRNRHLIAIVVIPGTVRNRLSEAGIRARRPYVGPPLNWARCLRCIA